MIFSKFFKAKWQNKDSNVRITAINDDLQLNDTEQRQIIINLAQTDESDLVRKTALLKLNDFDIWLTESQNNSNKKIKDFCQKQITLILTDEHTIKLDEATKLSYISNVTSLTGLELWLNNEQNGSLIKALFDKLNKPQLLVSVFTQKQQKDVQLHLLKSINEKDLLEKLLKKSCDETVISHINSKLVAIAKQLELPKVLTKKTQLNLSKLLALTEVVEYGDMLNRRTELLTEWQLLSADFECLDNIDKESFIVKHRKISEQLEKIFAPKEEAYKQNLIAIKLDSEKKAARLFYETEISELKKMLTTSIFEHSDINEDAFLVSIKTLEEKLSASVLNDYEKKHFCVLLNELQNKLTQLPIIAQSVTDATHHISKISQLTLPTTVEELNDRKVIYNDWIIRWKQIESQASGVLPESIVNAYKEISSNWRKGMAPLIAEQKSQLNTAQKKMSELNRLISSGKFNIAFGVFKRIEKLFEALSPDQQKRIQKDFDNLSAKMADLSDWEHYIATPRKQKLLEEIKALVTTPLDNPNDQATKVKEYRSVWNTLGHADDEIERTLNNEFNDFCELAFAPCRQFYKEQEDIREQHLKARMTILDQVKSFVAENQHESIDWKNVDTQLNQFHQQWQKAGEVERSKYKEIQQQYNDTIKPLKQALKSWQADNTQLKSSLVEQAKLELEKEDVFSAIESVKTLQNQWKSIGYCGVKHENKLWKAFRTYNDALFKKRDELNESNKAEQKEQITQLTSKFDAIQSKFAIAKDKNDLLSNQNEFNTLLKQLLSMKPINKGLVTRIENCLSKVAVAIERLESNKDKKNWQNIFIILELIAENTIESEQILVSDTFNSIPMSWQKRLTDVMNNQSKTDRLEKTLEIEIFAGQDSPIEHKEERMKVQIKLMQEQMLSGSTINLQDNFVSWLQEGAISKDDVPLLARIKPIYC